MVLRTAMKIFGWMKVKIKAVLVCLFLFFITTFANAQDEIYKYFQLDSVVIHASGNELDLASFIKYMIDDKSFYQSFKNLRSVNYFFTNEIIIWKNNKSIAGYKSKANQIYNTPCRTMMEWDKVLTGDMFTKNDNYNKIASIY